VTGLQNNFFQRTDFSNNEWPRQRSPEIDRPCADSTKANIARLSNI